MDIVTVVFKIESGTWSLKGCEGIYEASAWKCDTCSETQRDACRSLLNKHPDFAGRTIV